MKSVNLNAPNSTQPARLQQLERVRAKTEESLAPSSAQSTPDQVIVSHRAEEASRLVSRAVEARDFRPELVYSLQQAIRSGQYQISSSRIADAIIRDEA